MQQATGMVLKGCADKANVNKQQPMALQQLHDDDRSRDLASNPSTRLFQRAIVIWDGPKNANFGPFHTILGHFEPFQTILNGHYCQKRRATSKS